jgi:hypothetical protein
MNSSMAAMQAIDRKRTKGGIRWNAALCVTMYLAI